MPLPYSDRKVGAASDPVKTIKMETNEDSEMDLLEVCAEDLKEAMKAGDVKGIAAALRAAFEHLDSEPHMEGPHTNA